MLLNNYNETLSKRFQDTDIKPDKQYSFLPTVLGILGNLSGKTVLDLGCGDGFFTRALVKAGAKKVIGIDNSEVQIRLAKEKQTEDNIEYILRDIYKDKLPMADVVLSPFVVNYAESTQALVFIFKNIYESLSDGGRALLVVDLPRGKNLKKFGSIKTLEGKPTNGTKIKIELYNGEDFICTLYSNYYTPDTLENTLKTTGFGSIEWHNPIISNNGIEKYGEEFWKGFIEDSELGYLSVKK